MTLSLWDHTSSRFYHAVHDRFAIKLLLKIITELRTAAYLLLSACQPIQDSFIIKYQGSYGTELLFPIAWSIFKKKYSSPSFHETLQNLHELFRMTTVTITTKTFYIHWSIKSLINYPFYRSIFSAIADVQLEKAHEPEHDDSDHDSDHRGGPYSRGGMRRTPGLAASPHDRAQTGTPLSALTRSTTPPKIDKRLHQHYVR